MSAITITAIVVGINLIGMTLISSFLAFFLARLSWRNRGIAAVLITIVLAQLFWIVPTIIGFKYMIGADNPVQETATSYSLLFGNCVVSAFSILFFCRTMKRVPRGLDDTARLDGSGWFGTYWHIIIPLVRVDLGLIALLIVMATALPLLTDFVHAFSNTPPLPAADAILRMLAWSGIATVFVFAIFLIAQRVGSRLD